jgi:hypothetical protein
MTNKQGTQMQFEDAIAIVNEIGAEQGEGLLETLQYMDRNLFQFEAEQRQAFRVVFSSMRKLFYGDAE